MPARGATLTPVALEVEDTPDGAAVVGWPDLDDDPSTLLLLADPFSFPVDGFLRRLNEDRPGLTVIGGLASAGGAPGGNRLVLDGEVLEDGAVGVFLDGRRRRHGRVAGLPPDRRRRSSSRAPSGTSSRSSAASRRSTACRSSPTAATDDERELLRNGLHIGLVVDEHKVEFGRGDFLVRNVLGADQESGALAVGDQVEVGQTVQFHVRDAAAADEDLRELLRGVDARAALVFTCNGRGRHLFGVPDHDAGVVERAARPDPARPARSAPARSARSAAATSSTASPPASPSSTLTRRRAPQRPSRR